MAPRRKDPGNDGISGFSDPLMITRSTQTEAQPAKPSLCVPLLLLKDDEKMKYCYHGGKCRCELCKIIRKQQLDELDKNLDAFVPHTRLKLVPTIRQAKHKPYAPQASYVSPQFGLMLLKQHLQIIKDVPIYYLPEKYYSKYAYKVQGPQEVGTQTEILIGNYGVEGCPCPNKVVCWDI